MVKNKAKVILVVAVSTLLLSGFGTGQVFADTPVDCSLPDLSEVQMLDCASQNGAPVLAQDLQVKTYVSVNGSPYVLTPTLAQAPIVLVGDSISWKIEVVNLSLDPIGSNVYNTINLQDSFRAFADYVSHATVDGKYDPITGVWSMAEVIQPGVSKTLIVSTKLRLSDEAIGNSVKVDYYTTVADDCSELRTSYTDLDSANNSSTAWLSSNTKPGDGPKVLGDSVTITPDPTQTPKVPVPPPQKVLGASTSLTPTGGDVFSFQLVGSMIVLVSLIMVNSSRRQPISDK
jgi:hypothetical protein